MKTIESAAEALADRSIYWLPVRWQRVLALILAVAVYLLALLLVPSLSFDARGGILAVVPIIVAGWFFGARAGILVALVNWPFMIVWEMRAEGHGLWEEATEAIQLLVNSALIVVGCVVGRLQEMRQKARLDLARAERAEADLEQLNAELEELVAAETSQLSTANERLQRELDERVKAEDALQREKERLRKVVADAPVILCCVEEGGKVALFEGKALAQFTHDHSSFVGSYLQDLYPIMPPALADHFRRALAGEEITAIEELNAFVFDARFTPQFDEQGRPNGLIVVATDITEQSKAMVGLKVTNQQLANALSDLEAAQGQLIQRENLHAMGRMASGIAHDFNNSLTPILGYSGVLLSSPEAMGDQKQFLEYVGRIFNAAQDAAQVVARLREFYRPAEPGDTLKAVDVIDLVNSSLDLSSPRWKEMARLEKSEILVELSLDKACPPLRGDASELRTALTNLIFNAVDAMPNGGALRIRASHTSDSVTLEVSDTGTGMTEEVRRRALEPFFTTKGAKGTGLGLASVHGTMRRHGGDVTIDSALGKGTTVRLVFPVAASHQQPAAPQGQGAKTTPLRVLVVDDDPRSRGVVSIFLTALGHVPDEAAGGQEALDMAARKTYDLVITDRAMPGINGDVLARELALRAPALPVLMVTGFGDMMAATGEVPPNVQGVLSKPLKPDTLNRAINELLAGRPADQAPAV